MNKTLLSMLAFAMLACSRSSTASSPNASGADAAPVTTAAADASTRTHEEGCSAATCKVLSTVPVSSGSVTVFEHPTNEAEATCQDEEVRLGAALLARGCVSHEHPLTVEGKGDAFTVVQDGQYVPSNWVGIERATFDTKSGLTSLSNSYWNRTDACAHEQTSWSFAAMRGDVEWSASCSKSDPCTKHRYLSIPRFPAAADLTSWSVSPLGTCATRVEQGRGTTSGKPSASFAVVLVGDVLFMQIDDDKLITSGTLVDHVDVWTAPEADGYMTHCNGVGPSAPKQTTVSLERLSVAKTIRVDLPAGTNAIAVTYVDTDDGVVVAGTLSTGEGKASTPLLGSPFDLKDWGMCRLSDRAAASWQARAASADEALWSP